LCYNSRASVGSARAGSCSFRGSWLRRDWLLLGLLTAVAGALRLLWLADIPPGLYHDEGFNGLDALRVLAGEWPAYFEANNGREPALIYIGALTVGLLGRSPGALRLAAAASGTLTVPATYLMARNWFSRRVAVLGTAILAATLWHVHLSRIGFRAVTLPLALALTLWAGARAYRSGKRRDWIAGGILYGLCFYTYLPIRFTPIALLLWGVLLRRGTRGGRLWRGAAWFCAGAALALAPLVGYTVRHWELVMGRAGQVSVFNPVINDGDLWGTLARQLAATAGMFFVRGDTIVRHNLPGRPVFDPLLGVAMLVGLVQLVRNRRSAPAPVLAASWVAVMLVPTWLAEDAPHFLRAVGVLPLAVFLPAIGLDAAVGWLEQRGRRSWGRVLACLALAVCLILTTVDYFLRYGRDEDVQYAFEDAAAELAAEVNRFVGLGWDGEGLLAANGVADSERAVWIDSRLWEEWAAVPFLVHDSPGVLLATADSAVEGEANRRGDVLLVVWPYGEVEGFLSVLPVGSAIEAERGALARGDLEQEARVGYLSFTARRDVVAGEGRLAYFGESIVLAGYEIEVEEYHWRVTLRWEALDVLGEDYTVFVHLRDGDSVVAQHDGLPAGGLYPTTLWRPGDVIVDKHVLEIDGMRPASEPSLVVGVYSWPTMDRLPVSSAAGESPGDELTLETEN
jgi:4-amino-4-deoxy-L-arabinose transferase-like glycosyltransferase